MSEGTHRRGNPYATALLRNARAVKREYSTRTGPTAGCRVTRIRTRGPAGRARRSRSGAIDFFAFAAAAAADTHTYTRIIYVQE